MKCFTHFLSLLPLCSTLSWVVLLSSALPWVAAGVRDLSSSCNTWLRLLLACLCCSGRPGPSFPQQQVRVQKSLSRSLTEDIRKETATCSCCQLRLDYKCLIVFGIPALEIADSSSCDCFCFASGLFFFSFLFFYQSLC